MAAAFAGAYALALIAVVAGIIPSSAAGAPDLHNITRILESFPEYSLYNSYLSQTKVCDEINSRPIVTCLVLNNGIMSDFVAERSLAAVKNALRLLTLLDYFDAVKLHALPGGATLSTTLLQATGVVAGELGSAKISALIGGRIGFASAAPGPESSSTYTKSVKQIPYNLSVIEVSAPIVFPGLLDAPSASLSTLTALLDEAGCKTFASLLVSSGMVEMFQDAMDQGLTVFAPDDVAFEAAGVPDLSSLPGPDLVTMLKYHSLPSYTPMSSLEIAAGRRIATFASSGAGKYELSVVSHGINEVALGTGVVTSRIAGTILDDPPVCVLKVDSVLLPEELFGSSRLRTSAPASAPVRISGPRADGPSSSPSPSPLKEVMAPATVAKAPAPTRGPTAESPPLAESPPPDDDGSPSSVTLMAAAGSLTTAAMCLMSWAMSRSWRW